MNFLLLIILLITEIAAQNNNLFDPITGVNITDSLKIKYDPQTGILLKNFTDEEILYFASNDVNEFYTLQKEIKWNVLGGGVSMLSMGPGLVLSIYIYYNGNFPDSISNPIPILSGIIGAPIITSEILSNISNNIPKNENYIYFSHYNKTLYDKLIKKQSKKIKKQFIRKGMLYWLIPMFIASQLDKED